MLFDLLVFKLELILNVYAWQHVTVINLYLIIYLIHEAFLTGMAGAWSSSFEYVHLRL